MATIFYPQSAQILTRTTSGSGYTELLIATVPNSIFWFDTGSSVSALTASQMAITASYAGTASYVVSASYAANGGTSTVTGSLVPITSSAAVSASFVATASRAITASYVSNAVTASNGIVAAASMHNISGSLITRTMNLSASKGVATGDYWFVFGSPQPNVNYLVDVNAYSSSRGVTPITNSLSNFTASVGTAYNQTTAGFSMSFFSPPTTINTKGNFISCSLTVHNPWS